MKEYNIVGKINSIESCGLVDGPGIRYVVFMQGCPMRCIYCHNPETWDINKDYQEYSSEDLFKQMLKYKPYFKNNGGVTFSGGEPLMQQDFLISLCKKLKKENINIALDTAGSIPIKKDLLELIDLIILDIKSPSKDSFYKITSYSNINFLNNLKLMQQFNKNLWIRNVVVPNINDKKEDIIQLAKFIKPLKNVQNIELLPYHSMGISKYENLKIPYPLKDTPEMKKNDLDKLYKILKDELK